MSAAAVAVTACAAVLAFSAVPLMPRAVAAFGTADGRPPRRPVPGVRVFAAATALLVAAVSAALHDHPGRLPAYLYLGLVGLVLAVVDVRVHRLPDALVLPSYPVLAVLLAVAALVEGTPARLARAVGAGLAVWLLYAVLRRLARGAVGRGDVKLAGLVGLALGWLGWPSVALGLFAATVLAGLWALGLLVTRRAARGDRIAYGPFLLAGTLLAVLAPAS